MRISRFKTYIWLLLLVPIFFGTCKKRKEQQLLGKWKVETLMLKPAENPAYWVFDESGKLLVLNDDPTHVDGDTAIGSYKVVMKSLVMAHLEIEKPGAFAGLWRIEKINSKILVIARVAFLNKYNKSHPYLRREFTNVN